MISKNDAYALIRSRSLFELFPRKLCHDILEIMDIKSIPANAKITTETLATKLYIVVEGDIVARNEQGKEIETLGSGKSLELDQLFKHLDTPTKWINQWYSLTNTTLLTLNFAEFAKLLLPYRELWDYLKRITLSPELYRLKKDMKLLQIEDAVMQQLTLDLSLNEFHKEQDLQEFLTSFQMKHLVIVKSGSLRVLGKFSDDENAEPVLVQEYFSGDYFFYCKEDNVSFRTFAHCTLWSLAFTEERNYLHLFNTQWNILDFLKEKIHKFKHDAEIERLKAEKTYDDEEPDDDRFQVSDFKPGEKFLAKQHKKKFHWLQQHDMMDCGAACLTMISHFYGKKINIATWRSLVHITREGASMLSLKKAAEKVGFDSIGVMSGYKALQALQVPMIGLMQYHFVVIYKITETHVTIGDPASQLHTITKEDFLKEFSNNALLLKPNEELKKFPASKNTFIKYFELFRGEKLLIFEILSISILIYILGLALPLFMQFIFDTVLVTMDEKFLRFVALIFIFLGFLNSGSDWIRSSLITKLTSKLDAKFTSLFLVHTLKLPFSYFAVRNVGDITTRLQEIGKIREFFSSKVVATTLNIFGFFLYASILAIYKVELLIILAPFILLFALVLGNIIKKVRNNLHETFKAEGKNQSLVFEQIKSLDTIKSLGAEISARMRYSETLSHLLNLKKKFELMSNFLQSFSGFYQDIVALALFIAAIHYYFQNQLTLGQVMAIQALAGSITTPMIQLMQDYDELSKIGVSMEKVDEIFTSKIEKLDFRDSSKSEHELQLNGDIVYQDVFFQYGSEHSPMVLKKINLTIEPGKIVAFVGGSGSGKTTLAYMLNRLYAPTKGLITLNGKDSELVPLASLRKKVAMISQDNTLFSGNFIFNIALGDENPDFNRVVYSAKMADAHDFIMKKTGGYYYKLGEGGQGLSGGQKQRINIARAIYRNPDILIMDEATSALDAKSEKAIIENLKERDLDKSKTTIIIAHRLNTIMHADLIYVFDQGHLAEQGTHKELMAAQSNYYRMFRKQLEGNMSS
jgi:ATP-binding cassette subfamily B protein